MKKSIKNIQVLITLLFVSLHLHAQVLDVTITNLGNNVIRFTGTATAPGFDVAPRSSWSSMNLTWRIPKTAAMPAPTVAPPAITPEITGEATAFTGASPRDLWNNTGLDLTMFDLTDFGQPDDGFWYFQVTGTTGNIQSIPTGGSVVLYEFTAPAAWLCPACVEVLLTDIPGIPISTTSFIDNGGLGLDVLNLVTNLIPLPVHFLDFEAKKRDDDKVQLDWKVSAEDNVKGYYVERSADALSWQTIGFVPFHLSPSAVNNYSLIDQNPLRPANYYRIREEDLDGRMTYSITRIVRMDRGIKTYLYPVPAKNVLNVNIQSGINTAVTIRITDVVGRTLHSSRAQVTTGGQIETIPVSTFKPGIYFIEIQGGDYKWSSKFIKE